jgi:hypothetical protein
VGQKAHHAVKRLSNQLVSLCFSCWARFSLIRSRLESAGQQRALQNLGVFFTSWSRNAVFCHSESLKASLSQADSVLFSAEQLAGESVALAEFVASLSEAAIVFHGYQLRRAYAEAESARIRLLDSAEIFAGRPRIRALAMRVLIEWISICTVQHARSEAWALCAATNARAALSEACSARALTAWAKGTQRFALARLLAAWMAWARIRSGRQRVGSAAKRRRERRMLAQALFVFGRAALLAYPQSLQTA